MNGEPVTNAGASLLRDWGRDPEAREVLRAAIRDIEIESDSRETALREALAALNEENVRDGAEHAHAIIRAALAPKEADHE
jgi:hypothetical protein